MSGDSFKIKEEDKRIHGYKIFLSGGNFIVVSSEISDLDGFTRMVMKADAQKYNEEIVIFTNKIVMIQKI